MQRLEANTFVRYALPALFSDAQSSELIPDDASWLPVNKETQSWAQQAIRLPAAWNLTYAPNADRTKTAGIKLAIVDDGYTPHEDIIFAAESTNPGFSSTHGTPVSSLASATGNNGKGLAGAMWESHLMLMGSYYADTQFDIHARNNMLQALQNGARIINYSYAGDWSSLCNPDRDPVDLQIILPQEKIFWRDVVSVAPLNVLFIFAAGNFRDTGDATVPAILSEEFPNVISVAGSDRLGNQASYSNYGPVSVWAPGGDKPTDLQCAGRTSDAYIQDPLAQQANVAAQLYAALPVNTYGYVTGTSEAAPLLAGVGGLMLAQNAGLTGSQLREIIVTTADHTGRVDPSDREITILNACRAVRTATGFPTNFALASSNPASGSANVPLSQSIFLSFNIPIDQNNPSSLLQVVASTGDRVSGTILVLNDESIEFIPSSQLLPGVSYLVDLRAITDKYCGDRLSGSTSVTFTTTAQVTTPPPPNDNFSAAMTIPSIPFAASVDITSATTEAGEPLDCAIGDHVLGNTVWYKFTPGVATSLLATLTSSESANGFCIVAYSGSSLVSLQRLGAAGANGHAQLGFPIPFNPNITYYIQVGGIRGTTGLVSFEFTLMPPAPGNALDDNFNANVLDSNRWTSTISGPGTITVTNQRVEMAQTNLGSVYTGLATSSCWITGDFDVQVDYNLLAWPAQNFHTVRLVTDLPEGQTGAVGVYRSSYADEEYQFRSVNPVVAVSTSDMSGRLRVTRKGTIVAGYYFNGIQFVQIGSAATNNNATGFTIDFSGPSSPLAGIAFDNFKVSADAVYCPSTLIAPASLPGLVAF